MGPRNRGAPPRCAPLPRLSHGETGQLPLVAPLSSPADLQAAAWLIAIALTLRSVRSRRQRRLVAAAEAAWIALHDIESAIAVEAARANLMLAAIRLPDPIPQKVLALTTALNRGLTTEAASAMVDIRRSLLNLSATWRHQPSRRGAAFTSRAVRR
jgi:hypothetical protein